MNVTVNGRDLSLEKVMSIDGLVSSLVAARRGVAVAVNGTVVPRSQWTSTALADGDSVEVLTAAQGG
jgi:sulfur carrier protein